MEFGKILFDFIVPIVFLANRGRISPPVTVGCLGKAREKATVNGSINHEGKHRWWSSEDSKDKIGQERVKRATISNGGPRSRSERPVNG